jgi:hypothetical protein
VESDLGEDAVEHRPEHRAAAHLGLAVGFFLLGDLLAVQLEPVELFGVPVMTTERRPLRIESTGACTVRTSWLNSSRSSAMRSGSALVTESMGDLSPRPTMPRRREISDPAAPMI